MLTLLCAYQPKHVGKKRKKSSLGHQADEKVRNGCNIIFAEKSSKKCQIVKACLQVTLLITSTTKTTTTLQAAFSIFLALMLLLPFYIILDDSNDNSLCKKCDMLCYIARCSIIFS